MLISRCVVFSLAPQPLLLMLNICLTPQPLLLMQCEPSSLLRHSPCVPALRESAPSPSFLFCPFSHGPISTPHLSAVFPSLFFLGGVVVSHATRVLRCCVAVDAVLKPAGFLGPGCRWAANQSLPRVSGGSFGNRKREIERRSGTSRVGGGTLVDAWYGIP